MNYKKIGAGLASFAVVALAGTMVVSATEGNFNNRGLKMNGEHKVQIEGAIESGDFNAFKEVMGDRGRIAEVINEENFDNFVQMHELKMAGDFEGAREIAKELGLGNMNGRFHKGEGKMGNGPKFLDNNGDGICDHLDK